MGASDAFEDDLPLMCYRGCRENLVAWWHHRAANEPGEVVNIRQSQAVRHILRICGRLAAVVTSFGRKRLVTPISFT